MSEQVLFVDDEPSVLEGIARTLRSRVKIHTATSGAEGLRIMRESGPFALVVSDMRMPIMDGAQFLAQVRRDHGPHTVRMILSGQSDLPSTIAAVNEGHIYRFLCKPCPGDLLLAAVEDGLKQHRLMTAEKVLLEQTLSGSIKMLIELLGMVSPTSSSRAARLQRYTSGIAQALGLPSRWDWGLAAFLSQIGCVTLPREILAKSDAGQPLSEEESRLFDSHPETAGKLLAAIPRLEDVAAIVGAQLAPISPAGKAEELARWDVRSLGQLLLRTAIEFDRSISRGASREAAAEAVRALGVPPQVIKALSTLAVPNHASQGPHGSNGSGVRQVRVKDLVPGMILDEDLMSPKGIRLVPAGQEITRTLIVRLTSIAGGVGVVEPFRVKPAP